MGGTAELLSFGRDLTKCGALGTRDGTSPLALGPASAGPPPAPFAGKLVHTSRLGAAF